MISLKLYFININIKRSISVTNLNGKISIFSGLFCRRCVIKNDNNETPLHCACEKGNKNRIYTVILLYLWNAKNGNENLVKYLVELGIDITIEEYLVEEGADIYKVIDRRSDSQWVSGF
ncbi:hypothetical protein H8356DRAFT_1326473 [Neocallimastix lanati (nom. inval.)]|nr:hypothetical protein H8356DRAFT_1326473 [Neocallimastix sp. JGI-2020a]